MLTAAKLQNEFIDIHKPIEQSADWIEGYMAMDLQGEIDEQGKSEDYIRGARACVDRNNVMEGFGR